MSDTTYFNKIRLMFADDHVEKLEGLFTVEFRFNSIVIYEFFYGDGSDACISRVIAYTFPDEVKAFVIS